jgi:hypothetical protein
MNCDQLNIVGVVSIEYLPLTALLRFQIFRKTDGTLGGVIELKEAEESGYEEGSYETGSYSLGVAKEQITWQRLTKRYVPTEKRYWSEAVTINAAQGDLWDNRLADSIYGNSAAVQVQLDTLQRQRFICRVEDENGLKYLIGSPKFPLQFKSSYDTKQAAHSCEFYGVQNHKALIWNF